MKEDVRASDEAALLADIPHDARCASDLAADLNDAICRLTRAGVRVEVTVDEVNTIGQHPQPWVRVELWHRVEPGRMGVRTTKAR